MFQKKGVGTRRLVFLAASPLVTAPPQPATTRILSQSKIENPGKALYKSGTGTLGRVCGDLGLGDARQETWGHQVWYAGMLTQPTLPSLWFQ